MSYRDYIEAQKKYIETKKQALLGKADSGCLERPYGDPPPAGPKWWVVAPIIMLLIIVPISLLSLTVRIPAFAEADILTVAVLATEKEFIEIKSWLEPEILANGLYWKIERHATRQSLELHLARGPVPDLLIIGEDLAQEYFLNGILAALREKGQQTRFQDCFHPLWDPQPFQKGMGLAAVSHGRVEQSRHLCTIIKQFVAPFNP